jgi:hypothetical protein
VHLTLLENEGTSGFGGGIAFQDDGVTVDSSILGWATTGGVLGWTTDDYSIEPSYTVQYSLLYDPAGSWLYSNFASDTDLVGTLGNLGTDPAFTAFDADGGTLDDDLTLTSSSPARDAGSPLLLDLDGSAADIGGLGGLTPYEPISSCFGSVP